MSSSTPTSPTRSGSASLRQIPIVCPGHSRPLAELQYSAVTDDGFFLISACHDKQPMLRRGDTGDWIGTFMGHKGAVWSATMDANAKYAATGSADFSVKFWDAVSGDEVAAFEHRHVVKSVAFTPDTSKLLTGGHEKILRVFDLTPITEALEQYKAEGRTGIVVPAGPPIAQMQCKEQIRKVVTLSDSMAVTGETDGTISVWNLESSTLVREFKTEAGVMDMEGSRQGTVLTVAAGNKVYFYDVGRDFALISAFEVPISFQEEGGASLHPKDEKFIAGGSDTWVRVFDYKTGEMLETHKGHHGPVRCLRYSPSGESFATGSEDGTIRIWQTDSSSAAAASVADVSSANE